jgi:hypothetical protein
VTADERRTLREAVDNRRRELEGVEADGVIHGKESTYRDGCRCVPCRDVATAARRVRGARQRANDPRRARLLAACADGSPVAAEDQVRAVLRMLNQAAQRNLA